MTTKKTKEEAVEPTEEAVGPTSEELRESEMAEAELLADMPTLRAPHELRLRHRNRLSAAVFRARESGILDEDGRVGEGIEAKLGFLDVLADIDEFAESIAVDPAAYAKWAEANAKNFEVFFAILARYTAALGE